MADKAVGWPCFSYPHGLEKSSWLPYKAITQGPTSDPLAGNQIVSLLTKMKENSFIKACSHIPFYKPMANNTVYMHWKKNTDPI